jgi:two-component system chemotaxis sensor kinase CheA
VQLVSGATVLTSGRVALLLSAANLVRAALVRAPGQKVAALLAEHTEDTKKRIICVDDSLTTRGMIKARLEGAGYRVQAAGDGETVLKLLHEQGADLLVSDVDMPGMDGFMLAHAIRSTPRWADLPIILVTARGSEQDKVRGVEVGANAYLAKNTFDQKVLLETIAQLL